MVTEEEQLELLKSDWNYLKDIEIIFPNILVGGINQFTNGSDNEFIGKINNVYLLVQDQLLVENFLTDEVQDYLQAMGYSNPLNQSSQILQDLQSQLIRNALIVQDSLVRGEIDDNYKKYVEEETNFDEIALNYDLAIIESALRRREFGTTSPLPSPNNSPLVYSSPLNSPHLNFPESNNSYFPPQSPQVYSNSPAVSPTNSTTLLPITKSTTFWERKIEEKEQYIKYLEEVIDKQEVEIDNLKRDNEELAKRTRKNSNNGIISDLETKVNSKETEIIDLRKKLNQLNQRNAKAVDNELILNQKIEELEVEARNLRGELDNREVDNASLQRDKQTFEANVRQLEDSYQVLKREVDALNLTRAKLQTLTNKYRSQKLENNDQRREIEALKRQLKVSGNGNLSRTISPIHNISRISTPLNLNPNNLSLAEELEESASFISDDGSSNGTDVSSIFSPPLNPIPIRPFSLLNSPIIQVNDRDIDGSVYTDDTDILSNLDFEEEEKQEINQNQQEQIFQLERKNVELENKLRLSEINFQWSVRTQQQQQQQQQQQFLELKQQVERVEGIIGDDLNSLIERWKNNEFGNEANDLLDFVGGLEGDYDNLVERYEELEGRLGETERFRDLYNEKLGEYNSLVYQYNHFVKWGKNLEKSFNKKKLANAKAHENVVKLLGEVTELTTIEETLTEKNIGLAENLNQEKRRFDKLLKTATKLRDDKKTEITALQTWLNQAKTEIARIQKNQNFTTLQLTNEKKRVNGLENALGKKKVALKRINKDLIKLQRKYNQISTTLISERDNALNELERRTSERDLAATECNELKTERRTIKRERDTALTERDNALTTLNDERNAHNDTRDRLEIVEQQRDTTLNDLDIKTTERDNARTQWDNMRIERNRMRNERDDRPTIAQLNDMRTQRDARANISPTALAIERLVYTAALTNLTTQRDTAILERDNKETERLIAETDKNNALADKATAETNLTNEQNAHDTVKTSLTNANLRIATLESEKTILDGQIATLADERNTEKTRADNLQTWKDDHTCSIEPCSHIEDIIIQLELNLTKNSSFEQVITRIKELLDKKPLESIKVIDLEQIKELLFDNQQLSPNLIAENQQINTYQKWANFRHDLIKEKFANNAQSLTSFSLENGLLNQQRKERIWWVLIVIILSVSLLTAIGLKFRKKISKRDKEDNFV